LPLETKTNSKIIQKLENLDWELPDADTRYGTHSFHPYSAKYIPQIPHYLISNLTKKGDTVLDTFLGSGTTLVVSKKLNRNAIGVDLNPLACLISKVKTITITQEKIKKIKKLSQVIKIDILALRGQTNLFNFQEGSKTIKDPKFSELNYYVEKWFQSNVIAELSIIKEGIDKSKDKTVRDFALVAFSSILRGVSNTASGFGNLMISKNPPKRKRIFEKFESALLSMLEKIDENEIDSKGIAIHNKDCRNLSFIEDNSIDLICTHPPYMASVPYAEYQRLSLWWLGFNQKQLDSELIGGKRSRKDTAERFNKDMELVIKEMYRVLKPKKYCCIVIGNPVYRGKMWELNKIQKEQAIEAGFEFLGEIVRGKYKETVGKMKQEFILVFKKP
jgi:DNA modification methylase